MKKLKTKLISMAALVLFMAVILTNNMPVKAAGKVKALPKIEFCKTYPVKYTAGDRVNFEVDAPNYNGKVEYRVALWNDAKKSYSDLWNPGNGYPGCFYTKWQPTGKTKFTIGWIISEPGTYRITIYTRRVGVLKKNLGLPPANCDSYIESAPFVVSQGETNTSALILDKEGTAYSPEAKNTPASFTKDVKITAGNITYSNTNVGGDIYISADNATLKNVNAKGTIFVDPGKNGSANLTNVTAANIKILSGGENSIHLNSVSAKDLYVSSDSKVRVEATGTTKIENTVVTSYAILDSNGGTLGEIKVSKNEKGSFEVELKGTFNEPIKVETGATIKSDPNAKVSKIEVATESNETVKFQGNFKSIEIMKESIVEIGKDSKILESVKVKSKAEIKADATASVAKVEIATVANETIKLQGKFNSVEINSVAKVELGAGSEVLKVVMNAKAELISDKTSKIGTIENKNNPAKPDEVIPGGSHGTGENEPSHPNINVSGVKLDYIAIILKVGDSIKLNPIILPSNATNKSLTFNTDNPSIISVASNGNVTALREGAAAISVTTNDGGYTEKVNVIATQYDFNSKVITSGSSVVIKVESGNPRDEVTYQVFDKDGNLGYIGQKILTDGKVDIIVPLESGAYRIYLKGLNMENAILFDIKK